MIESIAGLVATVGFSAAACASFGLAAGAMISAARAVLKAIRSRSLSEIVQSAHWLFAATAIASGFAWAGLVMLDYGWLR